MNFRSDVCFNDTSDSRWYVFFCWHIVANTWTITCSFLVDVCSSDGISSQTSCSFVVDYVF